MSQQDSFTIRPACMTDAPVLAKLMSEAIDWGYLSDLGHRFITLLHRHMALSKYSICYVAERDGEILGYAAWATNTSKFYREFLLRRGLIATIILLPKIFHPRYLKVILRGLTYFPEAHPNDPKAEILSLAVRSNIKQSGIGTTIFRTMINEFKARGITALRIGTVATTNKAGNVFYRRMGCELMRTVPFYKNSMVNVYVYRIT